MKQKKTEAKKKEYAKPVSMYPLKPEEALSAFMRVNPKKVMARERKVKNR
jgi:hypothetical protein